MRSRIRAYQEALPTAGPLVLVPPGSRGRTAAYHRFEGLAQKYGKIRQEDPFRPWDSEEVFRAALQLL